MLKPVQVHVVDENTCTCIRKLQESEQFTFEYATCTLGKTQCTCTWNPICSCEGLSNFAKSEIKSSGSSMDCLMDF